MADTLRTALDSAGASPGQLVAAGVGAPGAIDLATGAVSHSGNIPGWEGSFPLGATLTEQLGVPVRIGNDVDVATEAEYRLGAGKGYRSVLGVFWGTGVGGGLVLNGQRWSGRGASAEIGHVVVQMDGLPCPCGRRGCMEAYAGRGAMEAPGARTRRTRARRRACSTIMERRGKDRLASGVWEEALAEGDQLATKLIDEAMAALGAGVASANNLLDIDAIILGGGLGTRLGQPYADRLAKEMAPHVFAIERPPPVLVAALGDLGGAIGAALGSQSRPDRASGGEPSLNGPRAGSVVLRDLGRGEPEHLTRVRTCSGVSLEGEGMSAQMWPSAACEPDRLLDGVRSRPVAGEQLGRVPGREMWPRVARDVGLVRAELPAPGVAAEAGADGIHRDVDADARAAAVRIRRHESAVRRGG